MKIRYQSLIELKLRHGYYGPSRGTPGFSVLPSPASQQILKNHNVICRRSEAGISLYCEVIPDTDPPLLAQSLGEETPALSFWLEAKDNNLLAVSKLPSYKPRKQCFYFNNLSDQRTAPVADSPLYLGDSTVDKRLGQPLEIVGAEVYVYSFDSAVQTATLTLSDIFNNVLATVPVNLPEPSKEYRINLSPSLQLKPGRYSVHDNHGGSGAFYYAPDVSEKAVFGVLEIFNTTTHLTGDSSEMVPAPYRYISAVNALTVIDPYVVELESRATIWRYIVTKKYTNNSIDLNELDILDPESEVQFIKTPGTKKITFTADDTLALRETGKRIELHRSNTKLRELPVPTMTTALQQDPSFSGFSSDIYVYV